MTEQEANQELSAESHVCWVSLLVVLPLIALVFPLALAFLANPDGRSLDGKPGGAEALRQSDGVCGMRR